MSVHVLRKGRWPGYSRHVLSNGWFILEAHVRAHYSNGYRVAAYEPGAGPTGGAAFRAGGSSVRAVLASIQPGGSATGPTPQTGTSDQGAPA